MNNIYTNDYFHYLQDYKSKSIRKLAEFGGRIEYMSIISLILVSVCYDVEYGSI